MEDLIAKTYDQARTLARTEPRRYVSARAKFAPGGLLLAAVTLVFEGNQSWQQVAQTLADGIFVGYLRNLGLEEDDVPPPLRPFARDLCLRVGNLLVLQALRELVARMQDEQHGQPMHN
jgi:hypothetical protein